jgi:uncharacterized membrane protein YhaH (DUF805 family)
MKVGSLFDYTFYRIYKFYSGKGNSFADSFASSLLTVMQCFAIIDIMVIVKLIHDYTFPNKLVFVFLFLVVGGFNWYRYEKRVDIQKLDSQWKDEQQSTKVRNGWMIVLYLITALLIPAVFGYLRVNLKVI